MGNYQKTRIAYLDICKALAIFLVVWGHIIVVYDHRSYSAPIAQAIYSMHCPFFMFLSGIFLSRSLQKDFKTLFLDKSRQLLLPYFAWSTICLLLIQIPQNSYDNVGDTLRAFVLGGVFRYYWYIKLLFVYIIVTWLFVKLVRNEIGGSLLSLGLFLILPDFSFSSVMITFFIAGHLIWPFLQKAEGSKAMTFALCLCAFFYLLWDPSWTYINVKLTSWPVIIRAGVGCSVSIFLILFSKTIVSYIPSKLLNILSIIGASTLGVYCCSDVVYRGYPEIILGLLPKTTLCFFLLAMIVTLVTLFIVKCIEKNKYTAFLLLGKDLRNLRK